MFTSLLSWLKALSTAGRIGLIAAILLGLGTVSGLSGNQQNSSQQKPSESTQKSATITHKTVTTDEEIPFVSSNVEDNTIAKGTAKTIVQGVNGIKTHTYDVKYNNNVEVSRIETSSVITKEPINQVISIGTYVAPVQPSCPNGTYVNSAGNTVCSPYSSTSAPAGATAQCRDGTYSFSQSRSGTCSRHGGVSSWL